MIKYTVILDQPGALHPAAMECLDAFAVTKIPATFEESELIALLKEADAVISWGNKKLTYGILSQAGSRLKTIAVTGTGVDNINLSDARKLGITVTNTPGVNANAVAEYTVCAIMCCLRQMFGAAFTLRERRWANAESFTGHEIYESTAGVIGLGNIGAKVGKLLDCFGAKVLGYDPMVTQEQAAQAGVTLVQKLPDLFAKADYVSIHVPLNENTKHMVDKTCFDVMKPHVWIINAGRAPVVNEDLLAGYLKEKKLAGYMTDVFPEEPPDMKKELYRMEQVYATPHIAAMTHTAYRDMQLYAARNVQAVLEGGKPLNILT